MYLYDFINQESVKLLGSVRETSEYSSHSWDRGQEITARSVLVPPNGFILTAPYLNKTSSELNSNLQEE